MEPSRKENDHVSRDTGLNFFGTITASVTHELNNVMSIIEQTAGLLDDLCAGAEYGRPIENEKLREISGKVAKQVDRGVAIIKRLNFFAHSVDEPIRTFELNVLLSNLVELAQRFAVLNRIRLEDQIPEYSINLKTNPFILEQVVFICIQLAITADEKDGLVTVTCEGLDSGAMISISGPPVPESEETDSKLSLLQNLVNELKGTMQVTLDEAGRSAFKLSMPNISEEASL